MARDHRHASEFLLSAARAFQQTHWQPSVDVYRTARGWLLKYELAGVSPNEVQLLVKDRQVTVRGMRRDVRVEERQQSYCMEISYNQFERVLELPCDLNEMQVAIRVSRRNADRTIDLQGIRFMSTSEETRTLAVLPIKNTVLYPYLLMPLSVGRERSLAAVEAAVAGEDKTLFVVAQRDPKVEDPAFEHLYTIGTEAVIKRLERGDNAIQMVVQGTRRMEIIEGAQTSPYLQARVRPLADPSDEGTEIDALERAMLDVAGRIQAMSQPEGQIGIAQILSQFKDPLHKAYLLASMLGLDLEKEQQLLEATSRLDALRLMHEFLTREVADCRAAAEDRQPGPNRDEQGAARVSAPPAAPRHPAGTGRRGRRTGRVAELRQRLDEADLPDEVRKEAERELGRLERLPTASPDYQITRTYLDLILELPWDKQTDDNLDLARARAILDEDHYDLKEVKERILEQLAVLKLNPGAKAPILCFVGPPGVGKTSLGQSIARALGRKFERMSLGGLHDESELRGHRRTYIGAMPGRIMQAMRRAGVRNPVLMLDEVDKLGRDFRGDPTAALLEILDPAQNFEFRDNYLNLPFDLSKTFFIATANTLDTIPRPLLDRMEILRLAGYSEEEKLQIAKRYLIRRQFTEAGVKEEQVQIPDDTLRQVISRYTREAGVRQLERAIGQLARKVAVQLRRTGRPAGHGPARGSRRDARPGAILSGAGPPGIATRRGHGAGLDRGRRRSALHRSG